MSEAPRRRFAKALMRHAARVMPRGEWGEAMRNELDAIADDHVALDWALGCVIAGYGERMNVMLQTWYARSGLACLMALLACREFFAPLLIFAYRTQNLGLAHFLGLRTAGDDYRRLIPVMDATPAWLPLLWVAAGLLFLMALGRMLLRKDGSVPLFFLAFALDLAGAVMARSIEASTGVIVTPNLMIRAAGEILMLSTGFVLWRMTRKMPPTTS
ncbi:MAG TPA: hypothetical protein VFI23_16685 [Rhizomicrobium sp.]|nr:hypothetical protein [Rhizomicrobium sp.]